MIHLESDEFYLGQLRVTVDQTRNDLEYFEEGLTDKVFEQQLEINKRKEEFNFVDNEEVVYKDENNRRFVQ